MARIAWIEDGDAAGEIADLYAELKRTSARGNVPDILRTMSLRPDFLRAINQASRLHEVGWTDAQIAEAVYDGALFNLFVRLADAFDIHPDPSYDAAGVPGVLGRPAGP